MQTTFRLKTQEISMAFLKSLKTLFAGQEVEITIRPVIPEQENAVKDQQKLAEMLMDSRVNAPVVSTSIDIRALIDESQYPGN